MTLGQGHLKVIQYIFPDLYFFVPNTWEAKVIVAAVAVAAAVTVVAAAEAAGAAVETNWKHKVTPDWGGLIMAQG